MDYIICKLFPNLKLIVGLYNLKYKGYIKCYFHILYEIEKNI